MSSTSIRTNELRQYRNIRRKTLSMAENLTAEQATFRTAASSWSPGEILDHLVKSQQLYQTQFEKLAEIARRGERPVLYLDHKDIDFGIPLVPKELMPLMAAPLGLINAFVPSIVRETLIRNRVIPAGNPAASQPGEHVAIDAVRQSLRDTMDAQEKFFDANPDLPYENMRVCHPAIGNNNVPALLRISFLHEQRHQDQLAELMKHPRFPKTHENAAAL
ncbi:MAG: DinB family protein [Bryobacteraceae bacterium]